jgi:hypothetical protein
LSIPEARKPSVSIMPGSSEFTRTRLLVRHHSQQCANDRNLSFPS